MNLRPLACEASALPLSYAPATGTITLWPGSEPRHRRRRRVPASRRRPSPSFAARTLKPSSGDPRKRLVLHPDPPAARPCSGPKTSARHPLRGHRGSRQPLVPGPNDPHPHRGKVLGDVREQGKQEQDDPKGLEVSSIATRTMRYMGLLNSVRGGVHALDQRHPQGIHNVEPAPGTPPGSGGPGRGGTGGGPARRPPGAPPPPPPMWTAVGVPILIGSLPRRPP